MSLDSIVINYLEGNTPEQIVEAFTTAPLSHAYGDRQFEAIQSSPYFNHELHAKLEAAWQRLDEKKTA